MQDREFESAATISAPVDTAVQISSAPASAGEAPASVDGSTLVDVPAQESASALAPAVDAPAQGSTSAQAPAVEAPAQGSTSAQAPADDAPAKVSVPAPAEQPGGLARLKCLNSLTLRCIGFVLMTCDHAWATIAVDMPWLTTIGRLTFPIFAFLTAEGFFHTSNFKKYLGRMFVFALIAELPFNMMTGGGLIFPFHQNVMFSFCLALLFLAVVDKARAKGPVVFVLVSVATLAVSFVVGTLTFVDYNGYGQWMVLLFYFCHLMPKKFAWIVQLAGLFYINWVMIGGLVFPVTILGAEVLIPEQGMAVLALIFIWLYNGKPGPKSKAIQYACYAYYPAHILVLVLLSRLLYG